MKSQNLTKKKGMTLIEVIVVVIILSLLAGITYGSVSSSQNKARVAAVNTDLQAYKDAFTIACVTKPSLIDDRIAAWTDATTYSSEQGLKRLVRYMNEYLDENLAFSWDDELKCYVSRKNDAWGGKYILIEYPYQDSGVNYFDPTAPGNEGMLAISIWATGNTDTILEEKTIDKKCLGFGAIFKGGATTVSFHGFDGATPFDEYKLKIQ